MLLFYFSLLFFGITACQSTPSKEGLPHIKVAAAASTQPVLKALQEAYQKDNKVLFENYVQASGKLTAQIEQGAEIEIFLSADSLYPAYLHQIGRTAAPPIVYAKGCLALWSKKQDLSQWKDLTTLELQPKQRLVMADPKTAPYGRLAKNALQDVGLGDIENVQLVYGQNIEQVNLYLYNEVADFGLTAHSSLWQKQLKEQGTFLLLPRYQLPQAAALIQPLEGQESAAAKAFYTFLHSSKAQKILVDYGYSLP